MSTEILEKLGRDIAAYVEKEAGKKFRNKAKIEPHVYLVSYAKIKNSVNTAIIDALKGRQLSKEEQDGLNIIIEKATNTTISNIKRYFNITSGSNIVDLEITINEVTGIDELKGGYAADSNYYSATTETIYDNIRNSFNNLKNELPAEINSLLKTNISRLNLVVGHTVSVIERRTRVHASTLKKEMGRSWKQLISALSNEDRITLKKLATGETTFIWEVEIEDGISNNPNKKLIQSLGITEARLAAVYKRILQTAQKGLQLNKKFIESEGSDSLPTVIEKSILKKVKNGIKKDKRVSLSLKNSTNIEYPKGKPVKVKTKKYKPRKVADKKTKVKIPRVSVSKAKIKSNSSINLNALKAQINARLSMTVIKNMGTPALENRTGRFARSVQVTDVTQTSKGFPSIGYTYQKYPYQTFEPGFKQGSAQRDPRALIDRSIREIASQLLVGRFYTRRV